MHRCLKKNTNTAATGNYLFKAWESGEHLDISNVRVRIEIQPAKSLQTSEGVNDPIREPEIVLQVDGCRLSKPVSDDYVVIHHAAEIENVHECSDKLLKRIVEHLEGSELAEREAR